MYDGVNTAVKNAKRRMAGYNKGKWKPSEYDPVDDGMASHAAKTPQGRFGVRLKENAEKI